MQSKELINQEPNNLMKMTALPECSSETNINVSFKIQTLQPTFKEAVCFLSFNDSVINVNIHEIFLELGTGN